MSHCLLEGIPLLCRSVDSHIQDGIFWTCACGAAGNISLTSCWQCNKFRLADVELMRDAIKTKYNLA